MRYEDAAEQVTVTGWSCKKCHRFFGDEESMARWCCGHKDQPCGCGGRIEGSWTCCKVCRDKHDGERWLARERRPWDGVQMIYSEALDRYFSSPDDFDEYAADEDEPLTREDARLVLCDPNKGRYFEMSDYLSDDLPEDGELDDEEINGIVNKWIDDNAPFSWHPGKFALEA